MDGKLEFANSSYDPEIEYYLLRDSRDIDLDLDEEDEDDTEEIGKNDYMLSSVPTTLPISRIRRT